MAQLWHFKTRICLVTLLGTFCRHKNRNSSTSNAHWLLELTQMAPLQTQHSMSTGDEGSALDDAALRAGNESNGVPDTAADREYISEMAKCVPNDNGNVFDDQLARPFSSSTRTKRYS